MSHAENAVYAVTRPRRAGRGSCGPRPFDPRAAYAACRLPARREKSGVPRFLAGPAQRHRFPDDENSARSRPNGRTVAKYMDQAAYSACGNRTGGRRKNRRREGVGELKMPPQYWRYLRIRLEPLEHQWVRMKSSAAKRASSLRNHGCARNLRRRPAPFARPFSGRTYATDSVRRPFERLLGVGFMTMWTSLPSLVRHSNRRCSEIPRNRPFKMAETLPVLTPGSLRRGLA